MSFKDRVTDSEFGQSIYEQIVDIKTSTKKHLAGRHDQSTHGGHSIPQGMNNWIDHVESIKASADSLDENLGDRTLAVFIERAGMGGKPTIVGSASELSGTPMYRGVTDPAHAEAFVDAPLAYQPRGQYGNGTYFTPDKAEAEQYRRDAAGGITRGTNTVVNGGAIITASWKPNSKVLFFNSSKDYTDYKLKLRDKWRKTTKMPPMKVNSRNAPLPDWEQSPRWQEWNKKFGDSVITLQKSSPLFVMEGIDGYVIHKSDFDPQMKDYTVVFNRSALEVVNPNASGN